MDGVFPQISSQVLNDNPPNQQTWKVDRLCLGCCLEFGLRLMPSHHRAPTRQRASMPTSRRASKTAMVSEETQVSATEECKGSVFPLRRSVSD